MVMKLLVNLVVLSGLGLGSLHAQRVAPRAIDVHARIETDRTTYRAANSIAVRVSLVNTSDAEIAFVPLPPWHMVYLVITHEDGTVLERGTFGDWQSHEWLSLEHWGYRLNEPGQYTITGIPLIAGPNFKAEASTPRSNAVTVTVVP